MVTKEGAIVRVRREFLGRKRKCGSMRGGDISRVTDKR
jgi:hypothetical protein